MDNMNNNYGQYNGSNLLGDDMLQCPDMMGYRNHQAKGNPLKSPIMRPTAPNTDNFALQQNFDLTN